MENWFEVDKAGLAKLLERKGKAFVLHELVQNAWDQKVTKVDVHLNRDPGTHHVIIMVEDDDPNGFADLSHAFTLFAESAKKTGITSYPLSVVASIWARSWCSQSAPRHPSSARPVAIASITPAAIG